MRGEGANLPSQAPAVGLPVRVFLFTLDQIAVVINVSVPTVKKSYIYFEGRSIGVRHRYLMVARNIAPPDEKPDWRVAERELIRWLKFKKFRYYEVGTISN